MSKPRKSQIDLDLVHPGDKVTIRDRSAFSRAHGPVIQDKSGWLCVVAFEQTIKFARPKANGAPGLLPVPGVEVVEHQERLV